MDRTSVMYDRNHGELKNIRVVGCVDWIDWDCRVGMLWIVVSRFDIA